MLNHEMNSLLDAWIVTGDVGSNRSPGVGVRAAKTIVTGAAVLPAVIGERSSIADAGHGTFR
jgi:hypothetical protein